MRILVTGARDWSDDIAVADALIAARDTFARTRDERPTLVHGACPTGADAISVSWAERWGWDVESWPADWTKHGAAAGPRRNAQMVALGADVCLAFIKPCISPRCVGKAPHGTHGTADCAGKARAAEILVIEVRSS